MAGKGAMGTVYRAVDEQGNPVALKVLDPLADDARFQAEVDALRRATHPNIVTYVAHGISAGQTFVVMEWLEGADLEHVLESGIPLKSNPAATMGATLAEALEFLHTREIVHRDVKPGNIFLRAGEPALPKLLDLGIARRLDEPSRITHKGAIVGTPSYMAPEAALGHDGIDGRADVFSLGCVLYEAVTARSPFEGDHAVHVLAKILVDDPVRPSRFVPDLDPRMEEAILTMLTKDVSRRPTAREARAMLERVGEPASRVDAPLTLGERRVVSVLLTSSPSVTADTIQERDALVTDAHVRAAVARHRGTLLSLPHSAILATFGGPGAPSDHAVRAADCALDLAGWIGSAHTAIVTARPESREPSLADRASQLLKQAKRTRVPSILIDRASEPLLGSRFVLEETPIGLVLRSAKPGLGGARTLRGRPTRCVGRDVELAMLVALVHESAQDRVVRSAVVVGDPGMGKTRLLHELMGQARLVHFVTARGESTTAFSVAGQLVRRVAGIEHGSSPSEASARLDAHVATRLGGPFANFARELLGEIAQVPVAQPSAALVGARSDPAIIGDSIRRAFVAWLAAETARAPLGLVIEDIHWADAPSLVLLAADVRALGDQPLFLLFTSRPGARQAQALSSEIDAREVRLGKLSRAASERYVRDLVPGAPQATVDFIV
ncbi:MAG: protein kinase, partial [Polyangiaceae bacterium]|nr:protein kinase [Polyangiaceae bacterium]